MLDIGIGLYRNRKLNYLLIDNLLINILVFKILLLFKSFNVLFYWLLVVWLNDEIVKDICFDSEIFNFEKI